MDIKLRARLTAYSKIDSTSDVSPSIPDVSPESSGGVLGVNQQGNYTIYPSVTKPDIDSLFGSTTDETVTQEDTDTLFSNNPETTPETVSHDEIDSLFNK